MANWSALLLDLIESRLSARKQVLRALISTLITSAAMEAHSCGCILARKQIKLLCLNDKQPYLSDVGRVQLTTDILRSGVGR